MSVTLDANVLVYAANRDAPEHEAALELVERIGTGPEIAYLFWPVLMSFLRISTHPAILPRPISPTQAAETVTVLHSQPHIRTPGEEDGFWELFSGDPVTASMRGNDVPDAHLVTLMRQHGVRTIYSRDRGFRRFDAIEVIDPMEDGP